MALALEGIRVIDLGIAWTTCFCSKFLALNGAQVIRVEPFKRPDPTRFGDHAENELKGNFWETGGRFHSANLNKLELSIDLTHPKGSKWFRELVKESDVILENFAPGVAKRLGIDYPSVCQVKPGIIMLSASGFGQSGPWVNYKGYGPVIEGLSGLPSLTGHPGGRPAISTRIIYADQVSAMSSYLAVLAALHYRRHTGKGQWIDLSEHEVTVNLVGEAILEYTMNKRVMGRMGNRHATMAPHGCYRCRGNDKWLVISISSQEEWQGLVKALGNPKWASEESFSHPLGRYNNQDELDRLIQAWTVEKEQYEAMDLLQKAGVAAGAVLNAKQLILEPHFSERGCFHQVDFSQVEGAEEVGKRFHLGLLWKTSKEGETVIKPSPTLGQHNHKILVELLGASEEEYEELAKEGIIGNHPPESIGGASGLFTPVPLPKQKEIGRIEDYDFDYKKILGS